MGYALHPQASFCYSGDQLIIIDLRSNQYLCLPDRMRAAFTRLCGGADSPPKDEMVLSPLFDSGVLRRTRHAGLPSPCAGHADDLAQAAEGDATVGDLAGFSLSYLRAKLQLRRKPLSTVLASFQTATPQRADKSDALVAARASDASKKFAMLHSMHGKCLVHSLAVVDWLVRRENRPFLVFGVTGRPFAAHCWVQLRNIVINDRPEHVRMFTPIIII